jgi:hypothetical protein
MTYHTPAHHPKEWRRREGLSIRGEIPCTLKSVKYFLLGEIVNLPDCKAPQDRNSNETTQRIECQSLLREDTSRVREFTHWCIDEELIINVFEHIGDLVFLQPTVYWRLHDRIFRCRRLQIFQELSFPPYFRDV